jgi:putative PIN family toxin of toxin-antitoxin system
VKLVLDTNVFVSGVFFNGPPFEILRSWREGKFALVVSPEILEEYNRVGELLAQEYQPINLSPMLEFLAQHATIVQSPPLPLQVCDDLEDDKFLACALASGSKLIVSGDKHLLKVTGYKSIEVIKPREFIDRYGD